MEGGLGPRRSRRLDLSSWYQFGVEAGYARHRHGSQYHDRAHQNHKDRFPEQKHVVGVFAEIAVCLYLRMPPHTHIHTDRLDGGIDLVTSAGSLQVKARMTGRHGYRDWLRSGHHPRELGCDWAVLCWAVGWPIMEIAGVLPKEDYDGLVAWSDRTKGWIIDWHYFHDVSMLTEAIRCTKPLCETKKSSQWAKDSCARSE